MILHRLFVVMLVHVVISARALATCPAEPPALLEELDKAYAAYAAIDVPSFGNHAAAALANAGCLTGRVEPVVAGRLHLVRALDAWTKRDAAGLSNALRGLTSAVPEAALGEEIAPEGSMVRQAFERERATPPSEGRTIHLPPGTVLFVDGRPAFTTIPVGRAALVQVEPRDAAPHSWYLDGSVVPGDLLALIDPPTVKPVEVTGVLPDVVSPMALRAEVRASRPLLVGSVGTALASTIMLAVAWSEYHRFDDAQTSEEASAIFDANQAFGYTGYGLGLVAVGLGASAVIVGRW